MPKLTINDKEYHTDDFNEEQMNMYREINLAREEMARMDYLMRVLDARCGQLASTIVSIADESTEEVVEEPDADK